MASETQYHYDHDTVNRYREPGSFIAPETVDAIAALKSKWGNDQVKSALRGYHIDADGDGRRVRAKRMFERFGYPTQEEYDLARELHATTVKAKGAHMDADRRDELLYEQRKGLRSNANVEWHIAEEERKAAKAVDRDAFEVLGTMTEYINILNDNRDVMMTDEQKAEAVAKWRAEREYEAAKAELNEQAQELYKHGHGTAAIDLRASHPDLV